MAFPVFAAAILDYPWRMIDLALQEMHQSLGARFGQAGGLMVVDHYGDRAGEYAALRESVGLLDLSFRGRLCLTGADRQRFLNGQVTNNVKDLAPGRGCYAAILNHKGKMQGDLNIHALAGELLLDFEPGQTEAVTARLAKYIIADDVQIVNVAPHYGLLSLQGPKAAEALAACGLGVTPPAGEFQSATVNHAAWGEICVVNLPRVGAAALSPTGGEGAGGGGFDLFVPIQTLVQMWSQLLSAVARAGGRACGWQALETARIEAGIPRFGVDMDETNLAPEAGIEARAISYSKGCYTGQEVIARIRTYGQVTKSLKRLRLAGTAQELPRKGDQLIKDDKAVGYVTSAVFSPGLQANVALGYVRRECNRAGTELAVRGSGAGWTAVVL